MCSYVHGVLLNSITSNFSSNKIILSGKPADIKAALCSSCREKWVVDSAVLNSGLLVKMDSVFSPPVALNTSLYKKLLLLEWRLRDRTAGRQALEHKEQIYQSRNHFIKYVKRIHLASSTCIIQDYGSLGRHLVVW
jgi:hypothetical protein